MKSPHLDQRACFPQAYWILYSKESCNTLLNEFPLNFLGNIHGNNHIQFPYNHIPSNGLQLSLIQYVYDNSDKVLTPNLVLGINQVYFLQILIARYYYYFRELYKPYGVFLFLLLLFVKKLASFNVFGFTFIFHNGLRG